MNAPRALSSLVASCAALFFALAVTPSTLAHFGAEAFIHVPRDHVNPGDEFPIIAADLDPETPVPLTLVYGDTAVDLGSVSTDAEGHVEATLVMPASVPHGYVQLVATSPDIGEVSTWVLIGPREQAPPGGPPTSAAGSEWWLDPSVLVLAAIVGIAGVALLLVAIRSARRGEAVPALARTGGRMPSKASRRRRR